MNYYPNNFYPNYNSYGNYQTQQFQQQQQNQLSLNPAAAAQQGIQGKMVDSEEVVRVTEVPFGGYGVFPRADLNEVYIKSWNNNGTTKIITYKPIVPETVQENADSKKAILDRMDTLEQKIDSLINQVRVPDNTTVKKEEKVKEEKINVY